MAGKVGIIKRKELFDQDWERLNTTKQIMPSNSYMMTAGPPSEKNDEVIEEVCQTMYFDEDRNEFVSYPPYLKQVFDMIQEKGWISSLMDFTEFRDEWYKYIVRDKKCQRKRKNLQTKKSDVLKMRDPK